MTKPPDPRLGLSPELEPFATAIGAMCREWAKLEMKVLECLSFTLNLPYEEGVYDAVLRCFEFRNQLAAAKLGIVAQINDPACVEAMVSTIDYIDNTLRTRRNRYIHDEWWRSDQPNKAQRHQWGARIFRRQSHKPRDWHWFLSEETPLEDLIVTTEEIRIHSGYLTDIMWAWYCATEVGDDPQYYRDLLEAQPLQRLRPLQPETPPPMPHETPER